MMPKDPEIAVIGGRTGSFKLLQELKHNTSNISAIVNIAMTLKKSTNYSI